MKRTFSFGLLFYIFCGFLIGCKKKSDCNAPPDQYYNLSADTIKIKYSGHDTLRFEHYVDNVLTDTIVWVGQGKKHANTSIGFKFTGDGECGYDMYGQAYSITFKANKPGYDMTVCLSANTATEDFYLSLLSDQLHLLVEDLGDSTLHDYYSQLTLAGNLYYRVNLYYHAGQSKTFTMYYADNKGIVRIELHNKDAFQLID